MKEKSQHLMLSSLFVLAFLTLGCEAQTEPITITTVEGKVPSGQIFQNLKILGIVQLETHTDNRSDAKDGLFVTRSRVQIPVGTQLIIPVVNGWSVGLEKFPIREKMYLPGHQKIIIMAYSSLLFSLIELAHRTRTVFQSNKARR